MTSSGGREANTGFKVMTVFGTRPEAIKMAPVVMELNRRRDTFRCELAVTAQHREMLDQVLRHFRLIPDYDLDIMTPRQSLTEISVRVLGGLDSVFEKGRPDLVLVHGDVATTFCSALAAFYKKIPVGHVEAGLRTGNKYSPFPEEMMRRLTADVADIHFAPTGVAKENLLSEGIAERNIYVTGNTAIDALYLTVSKTYRFSDPELDRVARTSRKLVVVDAHRRENWGRPMRSICEGLRSLVCACQDVEMVFSVHKNPEVEEVARTTLSGLERVHLFEPVSYPDWANLLARAYLVITDSGGLQEEAPSLGTPVLLLRDTTERPEALAAGTVRMVGSDAGRILQEASKLINDPAEHQKMARAVNPYGDGRAAERIADAIAYHFGLSRKRPEEFEGWRDASRSKANPALLTSNT